MTDSLFKASRSRFHHGILVFFVFLQCDTTSPCHLPFSKIRTSRCAFCLCVVFRWASQPKPSVTQAFASMLLADCCLQPSPAVWRNVEYSLLNCLARTGWEPSQAFTVQWRRIPPPPPPPHLKCNPIKIHHSFSSESRDRPVYFPPPTTHPLPEVSRLLGRPLLQILLHSYLSTFSSS